MDEGRAAVRADRWSLEPSATGSVWREAWARAQVYLRARTRYPGRLLFCKHVVGLTFGKMCAQDIRKLIALRANIGTQELYQDTEMDKPVSDCRDPVASSS